MVRTGRDRSARIGGADLPARPGIDDLDQDGAPLGTELSSDRTDSTAGPGPAPGSGQTTASVLERRPEQLLDDHDVAPDTVQLGVPLIDADLAEADPLHQHP